jgi:hypothetical protein
MGMALSPKPYERKIAKASTVVAKEEVHRNPKDRKTPERMMYC